MCVVSHLSFSMLYTFTDVGYHGIQGIAPTLITATAAFGVLTDHLDSTSNTISMVETARTSHRNNSRSDTTLSTFAVAVIRSDEGSYGGFDSLTEFGSDPTGVTGPDDLSQA